MTNAYDAVTAELTDTSTVGHWKVVVRPPMGQPLDITQWRGLPVKIGKMSWSDPFGPKDLTLDFKSLTVYDRPGAGDFDWLTEATDVDVIYTGPVPTNYPWPGVRWEGIIESYSPRAGGANPGASMQARGAMYQLDDPQAKPEYPTRPMPYEHAIGRQFLGRPSMRLAPLRMIWPSWWTNTYLPLARTTPTYLIPAGVRPGQNWTGMVTRDTGSWQSVLTGYIQSLLLSMYTERGRFTLDLYPYRTPVLVHRDMVLSMQPGVAVLDSKLPGVKLDMTLDWSQSIGSVYGQGKDLAGTAFSGMVISSDGSTTTYRPLAALRQVYPTDDTNGWLEPHRRNREVMLPMQDGLSERQATQVARYHLARFGDPGVTGTFETSDDLTMDGQHLSYALLRAGMSIQIPDVLGNPAGIIAHITECEIDFQARKATGTFDTRYRDSLTVNEVRLRGRDALAVPRMLIGGQYSPPVPDQLLPWNYQEGSGYVPSSKLHNAVPLFDGISDDIQFPWQEWTTQRPPSNHRWKSCYITIPANSSNADNNWAYEYDNAGLRMGIPIKMSQAGTIRMVQIAAYHDDGTVAKVPFHVSLYASNGVNLQSMPRILAADDGRYGGAGQATKYAAGQHYPFGTSAWENYNTDGTRTNPPSVPNAVETAQLVRGWGNSKVFAGYWPGDGTVGTTDSPTGLLVDENVWQYDLTESQRFAVYSPRSNLGDPYKGFLYMMIFCDQQTAPVHFLGRIFRVEPGQSV